MKELEWEESVIREKNNSRVVAGDTGRSTRCKQTCHSTDRNTCSICGKSSSHEYHSCPARNMLGSYDSIIITHCNMC